MCIIEWCNNNQGFLNCLLSLLLILFAVLEWCISATNQKFDIYKIKGEHYKNIHNIIGEFITLIPYKFSNNQFKIISEDITINENFIKKINELYINLNLYMLEAKHLFNKRVFKFEQELYNVIFKIRLHLSKKHDLSEWIDNVCDDIKKLAENIENKDLIFEEDLNVSKEIKYFRINVFKIILGVIFIFILLLNSISIFYNNKKKCTLYTNVYQNVTTTNLSNNISSQTETHLQSTITRKRTMKHHKKK